MQNSFRWAEWILGAWICLWLVACGSGGDREARTTPDPLGGVESEVQNDVPMPGALVLSAGEEESESPIKPWSGWWWPTRDRRLLKVMEKWDRARVRSGVNSLAASFEESELIRDDALPWEGHCDAWAMAALSVPEPRIPIKWGGETFSVGDQKALLVKSFEKVKGKRIVGKPFRGDSQSDHSDLNPLEFHRFMIEELFVRHRPFVIDKDPGLPVWNTPVWKAEVNVTPLDEWTWRVVTWLWGADPWVDSLDQIGTKTVALGYIYDFQGRTLSDGRFEVHAGEWIADPNGLLDSRMDHPDFAVSIPISDYESESRNIWVDAREVLKAFVTGG